jgi:glycosyltransferase involved in cell wall biosynthesis
VAVGYPEHKVVTHLLGIPLPDVPERSGTGAADPVILFVGRLVENKGLAYLLSACSQLSAQGSRFRLRVVGDGPLAPEYRAQAQPLGACVQFLGFLSPSQVQEQLVSADIFCMPSTRAPNGDNEGLGLVYLEAQGAGLPVVAFDQGPIPEAVLDGVTGVLAEDKSAESLAAALQRLIDNPDLRHKMGVAGRRFVEERFDIRKQSRELDRLYSAAISGEVVS